MRCARSTVFYILFFCFVGTVVILTGAFYKQDANLTITTVAEETKKEIEITEIEVTEAELYQSGDDVVIPTY